MKIIGVIAEYNPFHLGHKYQIDEIKKLYPDSLVIAIVGGHFTERGDISVINKWDKAKICLDNGIDMVVELPTLYAIQSADMFAYGAINILHSLHIDTLVFGTESDNIDDIKRLASIAVDNSEYDKLIKDYLKKGVNYPTAKSKALYDISGILIDKPNDLLALSYIKEIIRNHYDINPVGIKRTNDYHGKTIDSNIVNASLIRSLIKEKKKITEFIPHNTVKYINKDIDINMAYPYLLYNLLLNQDILPTYLMVDEGIENRIIKWASNSKNWNELVMNIKTKRYTYNKIKRILVSILLGIKKDDNTHEVYLRILGFNKKGQNYLNKIKKEIAIPIYTGYKKQQSRVFDIEYEATYVYGLISENLDLVKKEYQNKPIIKND